MLKKKVERWDNYEDEKFRRFLELQDPEFRQKLLEVMKEHVQEINLVDSFFIRNKVPSRPKTAQPRAIAAASNANPAKHVTYKDIAASIADATSQRHNTQPNEQTRGYEVHSELSERVDPMDDSERCSRSQTQNGRPQIQQSYNAREAIRMEPHDTNHRTKKEVRMMVE
jgi:hypothetical protein